MPSLARFVQKPFKKEQEGEGEGAKRHSSLRHETLLLFAADLLLRWSWSEVSEWSEVKWIQNGLSIFMKLIYSVA